MAADALEKRARNLRRLAALQRQLHKLAESELAETNRQRIAVGEQIARLVEVMGGLSQVHRLFPQLYARQMVKLKSRESTLTAQAQLQEQKVLRERTKQDRIGEHLAAAAGEAEMMREEESILDLLDAVKGATSGGEPDRAQASRKLRRA
ncbi:hypothetical protein [Nitratireductor sp. XY-223]|uniref:hypothetical protein n=1 Tax=Nitratireductor sp. XY-223 TaxID=2561926 RepID=UPI0010AA7E57|nr:hypothetical protein [Nitratireductor sp. XY-223]